MDISKDEYQARYRAENKERIRAYHKKRYEEKKEHILAVAKEYREANRDRKRQWQKRYQRETQAKRNAREAQRRAAKVNATPKWLSQEHLEEIAKIYQHAQSLGYHVDHIIPLKNKRVCGLHVPWNLRAIPAKENLSKYNRLITETEGV